MIWLSIDPAKCSGVAVWRDGELSGYGTIKPRGTNGKWYGMDGTIRDSRMYAWGSAYVGMVGSGRVIIERGFGGMATAVRAQGKQIGWHECMCAVYGIRAPIEVNVAEWRRVIREELGVSWPKDSKRCKDLAVQLVKRLYGIEVSSDEADAVLLGRAALRMGLVEGVQG